MSAIEVIAGQIADAVAESFGADRSRFELENQDDGSVVITSPIIEPYDWAAAWPNYRTGRALLDAFKVEATPTVDGEMSIRLRPAKPKPIVWRRERFGFEVGTVDGIDLFTVGPGTGRRTEGQYFTLESRLPGMMRNAPIPGSIENAKADAERLLATFVERITA